MQQKNSFALSTVWNAGREKDGGAVLAQIVALGFQNIELNFQFSVEKLEGVFVFLKTHDVRITGVHNYCPMPDDVAPHEAFPDCYSISSTDESQRRKAVAYTARSIRTANELGARYVVMHSGYVAMPSRMRDIIALAKEGKKNTPAYQSIIKEMQDLRRDSVKEHFDAVATSYAELLAVAEKYNIVLGLENRFYYREIPSPVEAKQLLYYFKGKPLGYWYDVGHAAIQESLGLYDEGAYIEQFKHDLFGVHLHDVIHVRDHNVPGFGEIDFRIFKPFIKEHVYKTIEVHSHQSAEDIRKGVQYLGQIFGS